MKIDEKKEGMMHNTEEMDLQKPVIDIYTKMLDEQPFRKVLNKYDGSTPNFTMLGRDGYFHETREMGFMDDISLDDGINLDSSTVKVLECIDWNRGVFEEIGKRDLGSSLMPMIMFERVRGLGKRQKQRMKRISRYSVRINQTSIVWDWDTNRPEIAFDKTSYMGSNNNERWFPLKTSKSYISNPNMPDNHLSLVVKKALHENLCQFYEWRLLIGRSDGLRISISVLPEYIKHLFKNRDRSDDKRLAPLIHSVKSYSRIKSRKNPYDHINVMEYLRGEYIFKSHGFDIEIRPSLYDLRRIGADNSKVAKRIMKDYKPFDRRRSIK